MMHGKYMGYLVVAGGALVVGLLLAGTPAQSLLPLILLVACPLMMMFMMRGMGHGSGQTKDPTPSDRPVKGPPAG